MDRLKKVKNGGCRGQRVGREVGSVQFTCNYLQQSHFNEMGGRAVGFGFE